MASLLAPYGSKEALAVAYDPRFPRETPIRGLQMGKLEGKIGLLYRSVPAAHILRYPHSRTLSRLPRRRIWHRKRMFARPAHSDVLILVESIEEIGCTPDIEDPCYDNAGWWARHAAEAATGFKKKSGRLGPRMVGKRGLGGPDVRTYLLPSHLLFTKTSAGAAACGIEW